MLSDDHYCFACGQDNPRGLQLHDFQFDGTCYWVQWEPLRYYQGWQNVVHGGIVATLLDEVMTRLLTTIGHSVVTAELTVRYHQTAPMDQTLTAKSWLVSGKRRFYETRAELITAEGEIVASAKAKFIVPRDDYKRETDAV